MGVLLVIIGAGVGAFGFNALVPNFLESNKVSVAALPSLDSSLDKWYPVFGGTKITQENFNELINSSVYLNGSNVKFTASFKSLGVPTVSGAQTDIVFQCAYLELSTTASSKTLNCYTNYVQMPGSSNGESKIAGTAFITFDSAGKFVQNSAQLKVIKEDNTGKVTSVQTPDVSGVKWFIK